MLISRNSKILFFVFVDLFRRFYKIRSNGKFLKRNVAEYGDVQRLELEDGHLDRLGPVTVCQLQVGRQAVLRQVRVLPHHHLVELAFDLLGEAGERDLQALLGRHAGDVAALVAVLQDSADVLELAVEAQVPDWPPALLHRVLERLLQVE